MLINKITRPQFCLYAETSTDEPNKKNINIIKTSGSSICAARMHISYRNHTVFKALKTSCLNGQIVSKHTVNGPFKAVSD